MDTQNDLPVLVEVRPNCSLSWRNALFFYAGVCTGSLGIAITLAWNGFWPVLPFAGLELVGLGIALWVSMRRADYRELIQIYHDRVVIVKGHPHQHQRVVFPLHWAHVNLRSARVVSYPSRLLISSHGRSCEIGGCLTETERRGLSRRLKQLIGGVDQTPSGAWATNN